MLGLYFSFWPHASAIGLSFPAGTAPSNHGRLPLVQRARRRPTPPLALLLGRRRLVVGQRLGRGAPPPPRTPGVRLVLASKPSPSSLKCHVCGGTGHAAGFVGSVYVDCLNKPCYLCRQPGHTTATCPHRAAPEHGAVPDARAAKALLPSLRARERGACARSARAPLAPPPCQRLRVDAAILRLHTRRVTAIEFPSGSDGVTVSGDKRGGVATWRHDSVVDRDTFRPHAANVNTLRAAPHIGPSSIASTGSDGALRVLDVETRTVVATPVHLNPGGWVDGVSDEKTWGQLAGMDVVTGPGGPGGATMIAGDTSGRVWFADARAPAGPSQPGAATLHRKGKVHAVSCCPTDASLLLTGSGDWTARLSDTRALSLTADGRSTRLRGAPPSAELASLPHERGAVVGAYFSPITGRRILTTSTDNRLRVWDELAACASPPSRTIVHSHDFNRYLTPFRAEFDPSDPAERRIAIGRYISESVGGAALHPVDVLDAATGRSLAVGADPNLPTIQTVARFHPRRPELLVTGSSRSLYAWRFEEARGGGRGASDSDDDGGPGGGRRGGGGGDDDDDNGGGGGTGWRLFDAAEPDDDAAAKKKKARRAG